MKSRQASTIIWCDDTSEDLEYLRAISEAVYGAHAGQTRNWELPASGPLWKIAFGDRAGILGAKLDGRVSCIKLFYDKRIRAKLRRLLGLSKARRAYRNGRRLNQLGIGSPAMWGYIERRPISPAMIVTELVDDGMRLDHWVIENGTPRPLVLGLAGFIKNMHDRGVTHSDLSPRNILIRPRGERFEFLLLDYEDARFGARVGHRARLHDLHHLHERMFSYVPLRVRLRFLRAYAGNDYHPFRRALGQMIAKSRPRQRHPGPKAHLQQG